VVTWWPSWNCSFCVTRRFTVRSIRAPFLKSPLSPMNGRQSLLVETEVGVLLLL